MRFLLFIVALLGAPAVFAAAWTLDEGKGQVINNITYYTTDRYTDAAGNSSAQPDYGKLEYNPYIEYGLTPTVTLGLSPSFQYVRQDIAGVDESTIGLADTEFFVRKRLFFDGENVIAIQPLIKVPGPYDADDAPALGQGQVDAELKLLYGHSFEGGHYANLEAGYRLRFESPSDEYRLNAAFGYRPADEWLLLLEGQGIFAADGAGSGAFQLANSADYDLVKLQLSAVYWLNEEVGLQFGGFRNLYARSTGEGGGFLFALWYRF